MNPLWMVMLGCLIGTMVSVTLMTTAIIYVRNQFPIPPGPRRLPPGIPRVEEIDINPPEFRVLSQTEDQRLREGVGLPKPKPKKELPDCVYEAFVDYTMARLDANGNQQIPLGQLLTEFARWHGPHNLDRGILRPKPPPIPEHVLAPRIEEEV